LAENYRGGMMEELADAEEAPKSLESGLREADDERRAKCRELERAEERRAALGGQIIKLEATVDLLVKDCRDAAERLVDADDARK
jgi:septal ring factor EnvC (AmiA/AmiB activator)